MPPKKKAEARACRVNVREVRNAQSGRDETMCTIQILSFGTIVNGMQVRNASNLCTDFGTAPTPDPIIPSVHKDE